MHDRRGIECRGASAISKNDRIFGGRGVFRRAVALRAARANRWGSSRWAAMPLSSDKFEKLRLLKMRMQLHLVHRRLDARIAQHQLELGDGHVRSADVAHQAHVHQLFHLAPGLHVALMNVGLGVGAARGNIAVRRMEVGKRPMDQVEIEILEAKVGKRLAAGGDDIVFAVLVIP